MNFPLRRNKGYFYFLFNLLTCSMRSVAEMLKLIEADGAMGGWNPFVVLNTLNLFKFSVFFLNAV